MKSKGNVRQEDEFVKHAVSAYCCWNDRMNEWVSEYINM